MALRYLKTVHFKVSIVPIQCMKIVDSTQAKTNIILSKEVMDRIYPSESKTEILRDNEFP